MLWLAYEYDSEKSLGEELLAEALQGKFASIKSIQDQFFRPAIQVPELQAKQHSLQSYDELLFSLNDLDASTSEVPF